MSLSQNPHLLYQLIRCKNLIDEKGHAISVHPDTSVLQLVLKKFGRNIEPHFIIAAKDSSDAEEYDGAKKYEANKLYFNLLSDSFVLSDNVIYPIAPIGDNYQQLSYFTTRFSEDMLEETLKAPKLKAQLRPYQAEGIKWIKYLYDNNLGGCLADDMGLGKTIQTIGVLTLIYPKVKKPTPSCATTSRPTPNRSSTM